MRERILNLPASKIASVHRSVLEQRGANSDKAKKTMKNDGSARVNKTQWQESEYDKERKKVNVWTEKQN